MTTKVKHLLARTSFGQFRVSEFKSVHSAVDELLSRRSAFLLPSQAESSVRNRMKNLSKEKRKQLMQANRQNLIDHNLNWLKEMATTKAALHEKMVLFWHGHFAVSTQVPRAAAIHNNTLRKHALGKFGDLLHAVAKDPAMLLFLNNQQNKKGAPNENFARELMELYTLGKGHYTEKDIQEAARAFTGWKTNLEGEFMKVKFQHDYGKKTVFSKTGNFDGEDIIDLILAKKQTAKLITKKLYQFFVNDHVNQNVVDAWAEDYFNSDYDTAKLLRTMFSSPHFYEEKHIGTKIKPPVEYIGFLMNDFGISFDTDYLPVAVQKVLGQMLLSPPNVAGWPTGKAWIDSSTLLYRLSFGPLMLMGEDVEIKDKEDFDMNKQPIGKKNKNAKQSIARDLSRWIDQSNENYEKISTEILFAAPSTNAKNLLSQPLGTDKKPHVELCVKLASLPEYQLF